MICLLCLCISDAKPAAALRKMESGWKESLVMVGRDLKADLAI